MDGKALRRHVSVDASVDSQLRRAFNAIDADKSGTLDAGEMLVRSVQCFSTRARDSSSDLLASAAIRRTR